MTGGAHHVVDMLAGFALCWVLLRVNGRWPAAPVHGGEEPTALPTVLEYNDTWLDWQGEGSCPVDRTQQVVVHYRNGTSDSGEAGHYCWRHDNIGSDIVAYKIV